MSWMPILSGWLLLFPASGPTPGQAAASRKASASLLTATEEGRAAGFLVLLAEQADLSAAASLPFEAKRRFVVEALRRTAARSQGPVLERLRQMGVAHRPFFGVNAIAVEGNRETVEEVALLAGVARLEADAPAAMPLPSPDRIRPFRPTSTLAEAGITQTRAPELWALGVTGHGIVVGGQDTGISWSHPALLSAYRGWNRTSANHDGNWHDAIHSSFGPCGHDATAPCDDGLHGTHTMGTVAGLDGANQIGMAPGAKWIGCRNMDGGNGTPSTYLECFEFFLAPYPVGASPSLGDPTKAPHVTNNSWACPSFEGCAATTLQLAVAAQRAAGIFSAVSAGNSGPGCSSVTDPPAIYAEVFSVGALETGTDSIASFSSLGPVTADGSGRTKPDIAAPGTDVRSSVPGGGYTSLSGTSMAAPHLAGAVALLLSSQPALAGQVDQTERILADSAFPIATTACGSSGFPNRVFGWGRLDVKAAVDLALLRPILTGVLPATGPPQGGGTVRIDGVHFSAAATVSFGGVIAVPVVVGADSLTVTVPPHAAGVVDVTVTNPSGQAGTLRKAYRFAGGGTLETVAPCRLFDTRNGSGADAAAPSLAPGETRSLSVLGRCSLPSGAFALSVNATVTGAMADGDLLLYRSDLASAPVASSLTFRAGRPRANNGLLELSHDASGSFKVRNVSPGAIHFILDVNGAFR